jgi:hypothetical protein
MVLGLSLAVYMLVHALTRLTGFGFLFAQLPPSRVLGILSLPVPLLFTLQAVTAVVRFRGKRV